MGRAVAITITGANSDDSEVYFCPGYYEPLTVHLKTDAFVFKNWTIGADTYRFDYVDGSGTAKIDTYFAGGLAVVDESAVDLRGITQKITDTSGLNCGFSGYYYPCDRSHGFSDSDENDYAAACYVYLDGDSEPKTFASTGKICDAWKSPRGVQCAGPDRNGLCYDWVKVPSSYASKPTSIPSFSSASNGARDTEVQV